MYVHFDELSLILRREIYQQMVKVSNEWNDQGVGNSLWGLQKMGLQWNSLPVTVQSTISRALCRVCFKMTPQAVGNILYSLGKLGAKSEDLSYRMNVAIELAVRKSSIHMRKRDVMQVIQGMALMDFRWDEITQETQQLLASAVFKQASNWSGGGPIYAIEISTLFYSLSKMRGRYEDFNGPLKAAILIGKNDNDGHSNDDHNDLVDVLDCIGVLKSYPI
jgi:hypothetical protein